jgi:hypothetical protein
MNVHQHRNRPSTSSTWQGLRASYHTLCLIVVVIIVLLLSRGGQGLGWR